MTQATQPLVYLGYTQAELDKAYTQAEWAHNSREVLSRQSLLSAEVRRRLPPETHRFGEDADEVLDVFRPQSARAAPVHVHVHGGGWRSLTKDDISFPAPLFVEAGAVYVALNFATIPRVRLPDMVGQLQRAIGWLHANAPKFGGSADRIHLSGHSSGGHLAATLVTTNWQARFDLPSDVIKSGLLMSGIYDLEPVMRSARRDYVKISREEEFLLSPVQHVEQVACPLVVAYGDRESPEFKRQAKSLVDAATEAARPARLLCVGDFNHFEVMDAFADPASALAKAALGAMLDPPR